MSKVLSGVPIVGIEVVISKIHHLASIISNMYSALSKLIPSHPSDLLNGDHSVANTLKKLPIQPVLLQSTFLSAARLNLASYGNMTLTKMIDQTTILKPDLASEYRNELKELGVPQLPPRRFPK